MVQRVFQSEQLTNQGPLVQELTRKLENHLGVQNLLLVANGTLAIQVALKALELKGSVIIPAFSFAATATSLNWEGLSPRFCDIDPETFNLSPSSLTTTKLDGVSAVMPVHVFGNPCNHEKIQKFCQNNQLKLLYDAAHAFDVRRNGESILNWGDAATLSFHATKIFHTVEGGAIIFKDRKVFERASALINFGFASGGIDVVYPGINAKMSELHAAMGLAVLEQFKVIASRRKEIFESYRSGLDGLVQFQNVDSDSQWNYSYCPILLKSEDQLLKIRAALNEIGIFPRRYFYPSLDVFTCYSEGSCVHSIDIAKRILCLPTFHTLEDKIIAEIIQAIRSSIR